MPRFELRTADDEYIPVAHKPMTNRYDRPGWNDPDPWHLTLVARDKAEGRAEVDLTRHEAQRLAEGSWTSTNTRT